MRHYNLNEREHLNRGDNKTTSPGHSVTNHCFKHHIVLALAGLLVALLLSGYGKCFCMYINYSLVPRPSHVFQCMQEQLGRPGQYCGVMITYLPISDAGCQNVQTTVEIVADM